MYKKETRSNLHCPLDLLGSWMCMEPVLSDLSRVDADDHCAFGQPCFSSSVDSLKGCTMEANKDWWTFDTYYLVPSDVQVNYSTTFSGDSWFHQLIP